jgi:Holliday junction resolvasome RuvABC endonuclease subunit
MIVLGMDTASNRVHTVGLMDGIWQTGVTAATPDTHIELRAGNPDIRRKILYDHVYTVMQMITAGDDEVHVFCEEPLALRNGKTTRLLGLAAGACWSAHLSFNVFWHWANVSEWKREVIGKGNATKDEIRAWSVAHSGDPAWEEDSHDAYAIATYGLEWVERAIAVRPEY